MGTSLGRVCVTSHLVHFAGWFVSYVDRRKMSQRWAQLQWAVSSVMDWEDLFYIKYYVSSKTYFCFHSNEETCFWHILRNHVSG